MQDHQRQGKAERCCHARSDQGGSHEPHSEASPALRGPGEHMQAHPLAGCCLPRCMLEEQSFRSPVHLPASHSLAYSHDICVVACRTLVRVTSECRHRPSHWHRLCRAPSKPCRMLVSLRMGPQHRPSKAQTGSRPDGRQQGNGVTSSEARQAAPKQARQVRQRNNY